VGKQTPPYLLRLEADISVGAIGTSHGPDLKVIKLGYLHIFFVLPQS